MQNLTFTATTTIKNHCYHDDYKTAIATMATTSSTNTATSTAVCPTLQAATMCPIRGYACAHAGSAGLPAACVYARARQCSSTTLPMAVPSPSGGTRGQASLKSKAFRCVCRTIAAIAQSSRLGPPKPKGRQGHQGHHTDRVLPSASLVRKRQRELGQNAPKTAFIISDALSDLSLRELVALAYGQDPSFLGSLFVGGLMLWFQSRHESMIKLLHAGSMQTIACPFCINSRAEPGLRVDQSDPGFVHVCGCLYVLASAGIRTVGVFLSIYSLCVSLYLCMYGCI